MCINIARKENLRDLPKMNHYITSPEVRLMDNEGKMIGIVPLPKALSMAREVGLDLIEVVPTANPPVCKIMGFDKYRYEKQKKSRNNSPKGRKKIKEIKLGISISDHDLDIKIAHANAFLEEGHTLRCVVQMRGRELAHKENGQLMMTKIIEQIGKKGKLHGTPGFTSNQIIATFFPNSDSKKNDAEASE